MRFFIYVQFGKSNDPFIHVVEVSESQFNEYMSFICNYFTITKEDEHDQQFGCDVTHYFYGDDFSTIASVGYIVWGNCTRPQ